MSRVMQIFFSIYPAVIQILNYLQYPDVNISAIWVTMKFTSVGHVTKGKKSFFRMIYTTRLLSISFIDLL